MSSTQADDSARFGIGAGQRTLRMLGLRLLAAYLQRFTPGFGGQSLSSPSRSEHTSINGSTSPSTFRMSSR